MAQIMARHGVRSTGAVVLATPSGRRANPGKPVIPHNQEESDEPRSAWEVSWPSSTVALPTSTGTSITTPGRRQPA